MSSPSSAFGDDTLDATASLHHFWKGLVRIDRGLSSRASLALTRLMTEETLGYRYVVRVEGNGAPRTHCLGEIRSESTDALQRTWFSCEMFHIDIFRTSTFPEVSRISYVTHGSLVFGPDSTITREKRREWRSRLVAPSLTAVASVLEVSRPSVIEDWFVKLLADNFRVPFNTVIARGQMTGPMRILQEFSERAGEGELDELVVLEGQTGISRLRRLTSLMSIMSLADTLGDRGEVDFGYEDIVELHPAVSASN